MADAALGRRRRRGPTRGHARFLVPTAATWARSAGIRQTLNFERVVERLDRPILYWTTTVSVCCNSRFTEPLALNSVTRDARTFHVSC